MIKSLPYYIIPEMFKTGNANWMDLDLNSLYNDLDILTRKHNLKVFWDYGADWEHEGSYFFAPEEGNLIDLQLYHEGDFRGYIGNFYITWEYDEGWRCTHIWFSGVSIEDDSDTEHWSWENK